jgi:uncharacterized C2H2 Zn-finger protein
MTEAICPKCNKVFDAQDSRTYSAKKDIKEIIEEGHKAPEIWIDESSMVRCPNCGNEFKSEAVRYFGILSPQGMKIFIGLFIFVFICFALWALVTSVG